MAEHEAAWLTHKLLIVETFAVLFRALAALFLPKPDPARRPGIAKPQCRQYALICMVIGYAAGTALEGGFNSQRSRTTLPI